MSVQINEAFAAATAARVAVNKVLNEVPVGSLSAADIRMLGQARDTLVGAVKTLSDMIALRLGEIAEKKS